MFSLSYVVILGLCATAFAVDTEHFVTLYDYGPTRSANNTIFYSPINDALTGGSFYRFKEFPEGYNFYTDYPTAVVYQPGNVEELFAYYFPKGFNTLFSYGKDSSFYDKYAPVREYFLSGDRFAFTPEAAFHGFKYFYDYNLTNFIYADDLPTKFAVLFVNGTVTVPTDFVPVGKFSYDVEKFTQLEIPKL